MIKYLLLFIGSASLLFSDDNSKLEKKIDLLNRRFDRIEEQLQQLQSSIDQTHRLLGNLQVQIHHINKVSSWFEQPAIPTTPPAYNPAP